MIVIGFVIGWVACVLSFLVGCAWSRSCALRQVADERARERADALTQAYCDAHGLVWSGP